MNDKKIKNKAKKAITLIVKAAKILIEAEDEYFDRNQQEAAQQKEDIDE